MAIYSIPNITIGGRNSFCGGKIYSVNLQIGLANEPSQLTISVVNESGDYLEPELSFTKPYKIQIPQVLNEDFCAVRWEYKRTSSGRIMQIKFLDFSVVLDRIYIGLKNKMGISNAPGLILVGREMHPCDLNGNGVFDAQDAAELNFQDDDPCELKCPGDIQERQNIIEACIERELSELFDIQYNFQDLLDAIQNKNVINRPTVDRNIPVYRPANGTNVAETIFVPLPQVQNTSFSVVNENIKVINPPLSFNKDYLNSYYGTLREVLSNWCSDFGWSFYWENGGLNFVDTKERPKINFADFQNLSEKTVVKSIEDTVARGVVSYYGEAAIRPSSSCSDSKPYMLRCFNLRDLFGAFYKPAWDAVSVNDTNNLQVSTNDILNIDLEQPTTDNTDNQAAYLDSSYPDGVPIREFEKMCVLGYYSDILRKLYILWNYYGISGPTAATNLKNTWLDRFGQRKIVNVFSAENEDTSSFFNNLLNGTILGAKGQLLSDETKGRIYKNSGYFVVTLKSQYSSKSEETEDLMERQFNIEQRLANDFFGRHWFKNLASPYLGSNPEVSPQGEYYGALSTSISDIPFSQFNHTYKSNISKIVNGFSATVQSQNYKQFGVKGLMSGGLGGNLTNVQTNKKNLRSIVYMERDTRDRWFPIQDGPTTLNAFIKDIEELIPEQIDLSDVPDGVLRALAADGAGSLSEGITESNLKDLELYVFYPGTFTVESKFGKHKNEENKQKTEGFSPGQTTDYGLMNKTTVIYQIKTRKNEGGNSGTLLDPPREDPSIVQLYLPVGASVLHDIDIDEKRKIKFSKLWSDDTIDFSKPGYKVLVTETADARGFIPKFESALVTPPPSLNARRVEYVVETINKNDVIRLLNKLTPNCQLPNEQILALHQLYTKNLNYSTTEPYNSREYVVMGFDIPDKINIKNGLEGISVTVGADGVFTTIRVGDSLFTPPPNTFILKQIQLGLAHSLFNARRNPI